MKDFKRKQHYIWKYYLRAWTKDEQILCKRFDKIFKSALENLGQSHFFYESIALNDSELEHLMAFFRVAHPTAQQNLTALLNLYIKSSTGDDYLQKCGIEEFHAIVENKAIAILKMLYKHDLSFFQNDEYRNNFSFFLGCQYTRTRKMRDNLSKMPLNISPNISKEKIGNIYSLFFGDIIGNWIYSRSKLKLFINNNDNCSFITADQPVINTKSDGRYLQRVQEFELYYPISPTLAIYLSENNEGIERINKRSVLEFNNLIRLHSHEQVYALNRSDLEVGR